MYSLSYIYICIHVHTEIEREKMTRVENGETIETRRARLGSDKGGDGGGGVRRTERRIPRSDSGRNGGRVRTYVQS